MSLFTPLKLRELSFRNRIFVSPMCQYSAQNGVPTSWHLVHLGSRAVGGAGLVMAEATAVSAEGRISASDTGLWNDEQARAFAPIAQFVREQGAVAGIQLAHAGRKASTQVPWEGDRGVPPPKGWTPLAPSARAFNETYVPPRAMTDSDIDQVVEQFRSATARALAAGFQVVEIHMAHGYLLHQFLSPLTNFRTDAYGGELSHRLRLPLRVASAVRETWPREWPVLVRVSATDWIEGGWDVAQTVALARELKKIGIDMLDCSSGGVVPHAQIQVGPGYQVPFARQVREQAAMPTIAVGLITEAKQAQEILDSGGADAVMLARELLRDPYWPLHAAHALGVRDLAWPKQYERAKPKR